MHELLILQKMLGNMRWLDKDGCGQETVHVNVHSLMDGRTDVDGRQATSEERIAVAAAADLVLQWPTRRNSSN